MARLTMATTVIAMLGIGAVHAQTYSSEAGARACIHKRLTDLIAQEQRQRISGDPVLNACTKDLRAEMRKKGKTDCQEADYISWLVANENSRINGVSGHAYTPNKLFIQSCRKSKTAKHRP